MKLRRPGRAPDDPRQAELSLPWPARPPPFRLRAGDVIRFNGRLCCVIRVNDCAAVVLMNQPARVFTTRFDKAVRFQPPPARFRISANSEVPILNRKAR